MTVDVNSPEPRSSAWIPNGRDRWPRLARTGRAAAVAAARALPLAVAGNDAGSPR
jgi:hypothetical protein